jgi:hypothetical protein
MQEAVPCQVHTILTDNGIKFAEQPRNRNTICSRPMRFDMILRGQWYRTPPDEAQSPLGH